MLAGSLQRNNDEPQGKSLLDEVSFKGIAQYIKSGKCKKIVTLAGAGISTCKYRGCGYKHFGDRWKLDLEKNLLFSDLCGEGCPLLEKNG